MGTCLKRYAVYVSTNVDAEICHHQTFINPAHKCFSHEQRKVLILLYTVATYSFQMLDALFGGSKLLYLLRRALPTQRKKLDMSLSWLLLFQLSTMVHLSTVYEQSFDRILTYKLIKTLWQDRLACQSALQIHHRHVSHHHLSLDSLSSS